MTHASSIKVLSELHPIVVEKALVHMDLVRHHSPKDLIPFFGEGHRPDSIQEQKNLAGLSNAPAGLSFHKYRLAYHILFYNKLEKKMDWTSYSLFKTVQDLGASVGLKTGIWWLNKDGKRVDDWQHFELDVAPIREVKAVYEGLMQNGPIGELLFEKWVTKKYLERRFENEIP